MKQSIKEQKVMSISSPLTEALSDLVTLKVKFNSDKGINSNDLNNLLESMLDHIEMARDKAYRFLLTDI